MEEGSSSSKNNESKKKKCPFDGKEKQGYLTCIRESLEFSLEYTELGKKNIEMPDEERQRLIREHIFSKNTPNPSEKREQWIWGSNYQIPVTSDFLGCYSVSAALDVMSFLLGMDGHVVAPLSMRYILEAGANDAQRPLSLDEVCTLIKENGVMYESNYPGPTLEDLGDFKIARPCEKSDQQFPRFSARYNPIQIARGVAVKVHENVKLQSRYQTILGLMECHPSFLKFDGTGIYQGPTDEEKEIQKSLEKKYEGYKPDSIWVVVVGYGVHTVFDDTYNKGLRTFDFVRVKCAFGPDFAENGCANIKPHLIKQYKFPSSLKLVEPPKKLEGY